MTRSFQRIFSLTKGQIPKVPQLCLTFLLLVLLTLTCFIFKDNFMMTLGIGRPSGEVDDYGTLIGKKCLHIAIGRLGVPIQFNTIMQVQLDKTQTSMEDLKYIIASLGLRAKICNVSFEELRQLRCPVLLVNNGRFVCVDPREKKVSEDEQKYWNSVRVYDPDKVAYWMSKADLQRCWNGDVLTIKRGEERHRDLGPRIVWDSCWEDVGFKRSFDHLSFCFRFRNIGSAAGFVKITGTTCGCTSPKVSRDTLLPGERGNLVVDVDLGNRAGGLWQESVFVQTSDKEATDLVVTLCGGIYLNQLTSLDNLSFGDVYQGQEKTERFFVHDSGEGKLLIEGVAIDGHCNEVKGNVNAVRVGPGSPFLGQTGRYTLKDGDFVITVTLRVETWAPAGRRKGRVMVKTNLTGELAALQVGYDINVLPDVSTEPLALVLGEAEVQMGSSLRIFSHSGNKFQIDSLKLVGIPLLCVGPYESGASNSVMVLLKPCAKNDMAHALLDGELIVGIKGGEHLRVPIIYVGKGG